MPIFGSLKLLGRPLEYHPWVRGVKHRTGSYLILDTGWDRLYGDTKKGARVPAESFSELLIVLRLKGYASL